MSILVLSMHGANQAWEWGGLATYVLRGMHIGRLHAKRPVRYIRGTHYWFRLDPPQPVARG